MATARKATYTASDIQVLEGLEPVRKRPAMYIGGTDDSGYHHLLWEIVDNSVDEVINSYASKVEVTLHKDGKTVTVADDGRGIPVDVMAKYKKPALEIILTTLHSGGKFEQGNYLHSGGLHGVGSSVVNALSSKLLVEVRRDGKRHQQTYVRGKPTSALKLVGPVRGSGTTITFTPDADIFGEKLRFRPELIRERLETKSYLHRGMVVRFRDETVSPALCMREASPSTFRSSSPSAARRWCLPAAGSSTCREKMASGSSWPCAGRSPRTSTSCPS